MAIKVSRKLLRISRSIHVYLSVFLLLILIFFSVTGFLLNHSEWLQGQGHESVQVATYHGLTPMLTQPPELTPELSRFFHNAFGVVTEDAKIEVDGDLLFVELQKPGTSVSIEMDLLTGQAEALVIERGLLVTLNELHQGRHAKQLWSLVIDVSAFLVILFSISGLIILLPQRKVVGRVILYSLLGLPAFIYAALY